MAEIKTMMGMSPDAVEIEIPASFQPVLDAPETWPAIEADGFGYLHLAGVLIIEPAHLQLMAAAIQLVNPELAEHLARYI